MLGGWNAKRRKPPPANRTMVEIECIAIGVNHNDDGVCLLIHLESMTFILDCGLHDCTPLLQYFSSHPTSDNQASTPPHPDYPIPQFIVCSHAHPDHSIGLRELHQALPQIPIYTSAVTRHLLLQDSANENEQALPLIALAWETSEVITPELSLELFPAGHLPGAAASLIRYTPVGGTITSSQSSASPTDYQTPPASYSLLYTGDFLLANTRLTEGLPLERLRGLAPDILILEGTVGLQSFPHRRQQENLILKTIQQTLARGWSVLIPTPPLGLGQELLVLFRSHALFSGLDVDIWVEEAIARGCDAYLEIIEALPRSLQNFASYQSLFWDEQVRPRIHRFDGSKPWQPSANPCIVLADYTIDPHYFQPTPAQPWSILELASLPMPQRSPNEIPPAPCHHANGLHAQSLPLSLHADSSGITQLIHNLRPQHIVFVHGEASQLAELASLDELTNRYHLHLPSPGKCVELPLGAIRIPNPASPASAIPLEGAIAETAPGQILITLPPQLTQDPRWQAFADTGIISVQWQGQSLVLQGLAQDALLRQDRSSAFATHSTCQTCQFNAQSFCQQPESPLFQRKVAPEGYCLSFAPKEDRQT